MVLNPLTGPAFTILRQLAIAVSKVKTGVSSRLLRDLQTVFPDSGRREIV